MLDAWIIDRVQQDRKEREKATTRTPLYAPRPIPPELRPPVNKEPVEDPKPKRGVIEDLDKEFLI